MSDDSNKILTAARDDFGKGAARRLRRAGQIPAVLYGHGTEPQHLALPAHATYLRVRYANAILDLDIEGTSQIALVKDIQRNPIMMGADAIEHIDLIIIRKGERVEVEVGIHIEGESEPGTITNVEMQSLTLEVDALKIPESITVSIEGLKEGDQVLAGDVKLPEGATLITDPEYQVLGIIVPQLETESTADEDSTGDVAGADAPAGDE